MISEVSSYIRKTFPIPKSIDFEDYVLFIILFCNFIIYLNINLENIKAL